MANEVIHYIRARESKLTNISIGHQTGRRLVQAASVAIANNPKIADCTPTSVYKALVHSARLGLDPSGLLGSGYLVPYGKTCQFIPGYRGLVDLAWRGLGVLLNADVVRAGEPFDFMKGTDEHIEHRWLPGNSEQPVTHAYATAKFKDGRTLHLAMDRDEIDQVRKMSKAGNSGPWVEHYNEMARKTVLRRICKLLPINPELAHALDLDAAAETGRNAYDPSDDGNVIEIEQDPTETTAAKLKTKIKQRKPAPEPTPAAEEVKAS